MDTAKPHLGPVNVRVQADGLIHCVTCQDTLSTLTVAMLLRPKMGASMDPVCKECAGQIISAAISVFQAVDLLKGCEN